MLARSRPSSSQFQCGTHLAHEPPNASPTTPGATNMPAGNVARECKRRTTAPHDMKHRVADTCQHGGHPRHVEEHGDREAKQSQAGLHDQLMAATPVDRRADRELKPESKTMINDEQRPERVDRQRGRGSLVDKKGSTRRIQNGVNYTVRRGNAERGNQPRVVVQIRQGHGRLPKSSCTLLPQSDFGGRLLVDHQDHGVA